MHPSLCREEERTAGRGRPYRRDFRGRGILPVPILHPEEPRLCIRRRTLCSDVMSVTLSPRGLPGRETGGSLFRPTIPVPAAPWHPAGTMVHSQTSGTGMRNDMALLRPTRFRATQCTAPLRRDAVAIDPARITRSKPSGALYGRAIIRCLWEVAKRCGARSPGCRSRARCRPRCRW